MQDKKLENQILDKTPILFAECYKELKRLYKCAGKNKAFSKCRPQNVVFLDCLTKSAEKHLGEILEKKVLEKNLVNLRTNFQKDFDTREMYEKESKISSCIAYQEMSELCFGLDWFDYEPLQKKCIRNDIKRYRCELNENVQNGELEAKHAQEYPKIFEQCIQKSVPATFIPQDELFSKLQKCHLDAENHLKTLFK